MLTQPHITKLNFAQLECPVQTAVLEWWTRSQGIADLNDPDYIALTPYLQVAIDEKKPGAARFIYVGPQSMPAEFLGNDFTSAVSAGEWWDDGGYTNAISGIFSEVSANKEAAFEEIKALVHLPRHIMPSGSPVVLHYDRLSMPTSFENGQTTFTVLTTQKSMLQVVN